MAHLRAPFGGETGSRRVEPRRKRKRTPSDHRREDRRLPELIEKAAKDRQAAWSETGRADLTDDLTRKLIRLYSDLRGERRGLIGRARS